MMPTIVEKMMTPTHVIAEPMDLATVRKKLRDGTYDTEDDDTFADESEMMQAFAYDVRLVFTNCKIYNSELSDIGRHAGLLSAIFEKLLEDMLESDC